MELLLTISWPITVHPSVITNLFHDVKTWVVEIPSNSWSELVSMLWQSVSLLTEMPHLKLLFVIVRLVSIAVKPVQVVIPSCDFHVLITSHMLRICILFASDEFYFTIFFLFDFLWTYGTVKCIDWWWTSSFGDQHSRTNKCGATIGVRCKWFDDQCAAI